MVEEMLAGRGISVTHETIRQWGLKFGREFANRIRRRAPCRGDRWHLDEVVISIAGKKQWLWRAVDQDGFVRCPRPEPARHDGRQALVAQAPSEAGSGTSCAHHR
jgi:DDE domain